MADVGLELLDNGLPAYREVIVTVPRQNGKSILLLAIMLQRALGWLSPQRILYSAQTGNDARKKLVEDWYPILNRNKKPLSIRRVLRGMGNEAIEFLNGSRIVLLASNEDSGHGKTIHLAMHDEIFADTDNRREQSTTPAMNTILDGQMWLTSTMGTETSIFLNGKVDLGRKAAEIGSETTAYFEWSAPDDVDIDDPAVWRSCMPALGFTIDERVIKAARSTLPEGEFRRAYLNQRTVSDERIISAAAWMAVQDKTAKPRSPFVFGFDVTPDRSAAAIVAADSGSLELVEHHGGLGWAVDKIVELAARHRVPVAIDVSGPAGTFLRDLSDKGVAVVEIAGRDFARACGAFFDQVADRQLRVRWHPDFDAAVAGAAKRQSGDAWAWTRRSSDADITPLVAATVACWAAGTRKVDVTANVW